MSKKMTPSAQKRRERIIEAGTELFLTNGIKGTTMEAISKAADVAKPTLYGYFPDKYAVFEATVELVFEKMRLVVLAALQTSGSPQQIISQGLSAKHQVVLDVLAGSAHAEELYLTPKIMAQSRVDEFDAWLHAQFAAVFERNQTGAQQKRMSVEETNALVLLLCHSADGIARNAKRGEDIQPPLLRMVESLLAYEGSTRA